MKKLALMLTALTLASVSYAKETMPVVEVMEEEVVVESEVVATDKGLFYIAEDFQDLRALPVFTINAPAGLVPGSGVVFGGISGTRNSDDTDGGLGFGFGYGNPYESVGGAASLTIGSIDPRDGGSFNRGSLNLSLGHIFTEYGLGAAVGVSNIDLWHSTHNSELDPSFYGAVTKLLPNDIAPMTLTVGLGNNMYADNDETGDKKGKVYPFVSLAAYVLPQMSLIADFTSGITSAGVSVVPFPSIPVSMTMGAYDISDETVQGTSFIAGLSAAYAF